MGCGLAWNFVRINELVFDAGYGSTDGFFFNESGLQWEGRGDGVFKGWLGRSLVRVFLLQWSRLAWLMAGSLRLVARRPPAFLGIFLCSQRDSEQLCARTAVSSCGVGMWSSGRRIRGGRMT